MSAPFRLTCALLSLALSGGPLVIVGQEAPFIGVRVDQDRNKVLLEITPERLGRDFLHQSVLATGAGVPALGLDRGQTGGSEVVRLERRGKRIVMLQDNWNVRAPGANAAGQRAAREAFASSVVASFPIESEANGMVVADATSLFLSDTYGIGESIRRGKWRPRILGEQLVSTGFGSQLVVIVTGAFVGAVFGFEHFLDGRE